MLGVILGWVANRASKPPLFSAEHWPNARPDTWWGTGLGGLGLWGLWVSDKLRCSSSEESHHDHLENSSQPQNFPRFAANQSRQPGVAPSSVGHLHILDFLIFYRLVQWVAVALL